METHEASTQREDDSRADAIGDEVEEYRQAVSDDADSLGGSAEGARALFELIDRVRARESGAVDRQPPVETTSNEPNVSSNALPSGEAFAAGTHIGRFLIRGQIGVGGFGVVLLAFDPRLDREVALKIPKFQSLVAEQTHQRFQAESKIAASLSHPNIATVYETGNVSGIQFITSEYCAGGSLAERLGQVVWPDDASPSQDRSVHTVESALPPPSPRSSATLVHALAEAIDHSHTRGIVHRDLKPANILFDWSATPLEHPGSDEYHQIDPWEEEILSRAARIIDFGLARDEDSAEGQTRQGTMLGTLGYMSPEQAVGNLEKIGPASDVYSLGAILYELLCGRPPLVRDEDAATIIAIRDETPRSLSRMRDNCPADLDAICMKCLSKSPSDRYETAADLATDLRRYLEGQIVQARPISSLRRSARWVARNRIVSTLSLIAVVLAICSSTAALLLARSRADVIRHLESAKAARQEAAARAFESNLALARSVRRQRTVGQRQLGLDAVDEAQMIARQTGSSPAKMTTLRNELIAAFSSFDLRVEHRWENSLPAGCYPSANHDLSQFVRLGDGGIEVVDAASQSVLHRLTPEQRVARYVGFSFDETGRYLGARGVISLGQERIFVWDLRQDRLIGSRVAGGFGNSSDFCTDGVHFLSIDPDGTVSQCAISDGLNTVRSIRFSQSVSTLAIHPAKPWVVGFLAPKLIEVRHIDSGDLIHRCEVEAYAYDLRFSPDGRLLAAVCRDGSVNVFEILKGTDRVDLTKTYSRLEHASMAVCVRWHPSGKYFVTSGLDGKSHVWDADTGRILISLDQLATNFSRDGTSLGTQHARWQIMHGNEHEWVRQTEHAISPFLSAGFSSRGDVTSEINHFEAHPRGRLAVGQNFHGLMFYDTALGEMIHEITTPGISLRFSPDGSTAVLSSMYRGLAILPVTIEESEEAIEWTLGPPSNRVPATPGFFAVGEDEFFQQPFLGAPVRWTAIHSNPKRQFFHPPHKMSFFLNLSPDGRFLATGTMKGSMVEVRDADRGDVIERFPSSSACPWFSPDGRLLAIAEIDRFQFWDVRDWSLLRNVSVTTRGVFPGSLAFSPDSKFVAIENEASVELLSTDDFQVLARFELEQGKNIESIRITADGMLIAGEGDQGDTHLWDLHRIRRLLRDRSLDWELSGEPPPNTLRIDKPLRLHLLLDANAG